MITNTLDGMKTTISRYDLLLGTLQLTLDDQVLDAHIQQNHRIPDNRRVTTITMIDPATQIEAGHIYSFKAGDWAIGRVHLNDSSGHPMPVGEYKLTDAGYTLTPVIRLTKRFDLTEPTHPIDYLFKRYAQALAEGTSAVNRQGQKRRQYRR